MQYLRFFYADAITIFVSNERNYLLVKGISRSSETFNASSYNSNVRFLIKLKYSRLFFLRIRTVGYRTQISLFNFKLLSTVLVLKSGMSLNLKIFH